MPNLSREEADEIFERLTRDRPKSKLQRLKEAGKLDQFILKLHADTEQFNIKRAIAGLEPVSTDERIKYMWDLRFREDQDIPEGDWEIWMLMAGRGWGKTLRLSAYCCKFAEENPGCRIGLFAASLNDAKDTMIEGKSGILAVSPPWDQPNWVPSRNRGRVYWKNGSTAYVYGTTKPDKMRGPEFDLAWCDELCFWDYPEDAFDQVKIMTRSKAFGNPKIIISTTPKTIPLIADLAQDPAVIETNGATYNNSAMPDAYLKSRIRQFYGTSKWIEEIEGKRLDKIDGALWDHELIDSCRRSMPDLDTFKKIVIGVDPAVTVGTGKQQKMTGIVVAGLNEDDDIYIIEDASMNASTLDVSERICELYHKWEANKVVIETNQGGDYVVDPIRRADPTVSIDTKFARKSKYTRAEPVHALYEGGNVHHCHLFKELEAQMCTFKSGDRNSPDRMDAMVHAVRYLSDVGDKPKFSFIGF